MSFLVSLSKEIPQIKTDYGNRHQRIDQKQCHLLSFCKNPPPLKEFLFDLNGFSQKLEMHAALAQW